MRIRPGFPPDLPPTVGPSAHRNRFAAPPW